MGKSLPEGASQKDIFKGVLHGKTLIKINATAQSKFPEQNI